MNCVNVRKWLCVVCVEFSRGWATLTVDSSRGGAGCNRSVHRRLADIQRAVHVQSTQQCRYMHVSCRQCSQHAVDQTHWCRTTTDGRLLSAGSVWVADWLSLSLSFEKINDVPPLFCAVAAHSVSESSCSYLFCLCMYVRLCVLVGGDIPDSLLVDSWVAFYFTSIKYLDAEEDANCCSADS